MSPAKKTRAVILVILSAVMLAAFLALVTGTVDPVVG